MFTSQPAVPAWLLTQTPVKQYVMETPATEADADIQLMLALAKGDDSALRPLVERWQTPLINFFYRSLHSHADAEDLAQQTFIRIYHAAPRYTPTAKFSTYLFHVARHLLINEFRRQARKPLDPVEDEQLNREASNTGQEQLREKELEEAFAAAVEALPENQRTAILLLKQQELSYEEIAEVMDASLSAVKTWIFRARQHLRNALEDFHAT